MTAQIVGSYIILDIPMRMTFFLRGIEGLCEYHCPQRTMMELIWKGI